MKVMVIPRFSKRAKGVGNWMMSRDHPKYSIVEYWRPDLVGLGFYGIKTIVG